MITEDGSYEGRALKITWNASPTPPPRAQITQASGLCFTDDGMIVLVAGEKGTWSLPGGHPEPGETIEQAFVREVREEACAIVEHLVYLGAQQVDDPSAPSGPTRYYQTRFWARVHLEPFHAQFEILQRRLVATKDFLSVLSWGHTRIAQALLNSAIEQELTQLIRSTPWFMSILEAVRECDPPDWLVGAGVIRNLVWDHLHQYQTSTPLADVDVVFFDPQDVRPERDRMVQQQLAQRLPHVAWEATNQAAVHLWYKDVFGFSVPAFHSSEEAVGTWPETATSVAVRLLPTDGISIVAPCGLSDLFSMILRRNPSRVTQEIFMQRLHSKQILRKWPRAQVIYEA